MKEMLNFGIVGSGSITETHIKSIQAISNGSGNSHLF